MRRHNLNVLFVMTALLLAVLLYSCGLPTDGGGPQILPPQTEILEVRVQPDTVAPGDTARFTCIIKDSLDKRFKFHWVIDKGKVLGASLESKTNSQYISESNTVKWVATTTKGHFLFGVFVDNGAIDSSDVRRGFYITVN